MRRLGLFVAAASTFWATALLGCDDVVIPQTADQVMNDLLPQMLPPGAVKINESDYTVDESIVVTKTLQQLVTTAPLRPGATSQISLPFSGSGNVTGLGIRFGDTGPIWVVPQQTSGTAGTLQTSMSIPDSVCDNLSEICHNIRCYEFAVTSIGTISRANIMAVAVLCGGCEEPSCQPLLEEGCEIQGCDVDGWVVQGEPLCAQGSITYCFSGFSPGTRLEVQTTWGWQQATQVRPDGTAELILSSNGTVCCGAGHQYWFMLNGTEYRRYPLCD